MPRPVIRPMRVAGGQISTSQAGEGMASCKASISTSASARPFIFQFPATSFLRTMSASLIAAFGLADPAAGGKGGQLSANLIDSPQPQASVTLGLLKRNPDSISPDW